MGRLVFSCRLYRSRLKTTVSTTRRRCLWRRGALPCQHHIQGSFRCSYSRPGTHQPAGRLRCRTRTNPTNPHSKNNKQCGPKRGRLLMRNGAIPKAGVLRAEWDAMVVDLRWRCSRRIPLGVHRAARVSTAPPAPPAAIEARLLLVLLPLDLPHPTSTTWRSKAMLASHPGVRSDQKADTGHGTPRCTPACRTQ